MKPIIASDIVPLSYCARRLWFDYHPPDGLADVASDPYEQLILEMGIAHEAAVLSALTGRIKAVEALSVAHTDQLLAEGAPLIYQPHLEDKSNGLFGKPDFLIRDDDGAYFAADAKLAHGIDNEIGVQLAFYRRLLGGSKPAVAYLGTGDVESIANEYDAKLDSYLMEVRAVLGKKDKPKVRYSHTKCKACPYNDACYPEFVEAEELTLLYGVERRSAEGLAAHAITRITEIAQTDPDMLPDVPYLKGMKKTRAVHQARIWKGGDLVKLAPIELPEGTFVHFDIEANPHTYDGFPHVYLWGFLAPPFGPDDFKYVWTDSCDDDESGWREFLAMARQYRERFPDLLIVHFSAYERGRISAYAKRYEMEEDETVAWLLDRNDGPLFDIQKPVTDNLVLPLPGYGLKAICKHTGLVNFQWEDDESGSQWSVVQYINYLRSKDAAERKSIKSAILRYNRDDVMATRQLEEWLRSL